MSQNRQLRALELVPAILAASAICSSSAQRTSFSPRVWVYSLVATDYDGHVLLPYFLQHYRSLGIVDSQFHFDLLHDPKEPDVGLAVSCLPSLDPTGLQYKQPYPVLERGCANRRSWKKPQRLCFSSSHACWNSAIPTRTNGT